MMSREEFDSHLAAIASGNWESVTRLIHYFEVDERLFQTPASQKVSQMSQCYSYMSNHSMNNNPFATVFLGRMLEFGYGVTKDIKQAEAKYRTAAEKFNNPWGQYYLGLHYIDQSEKSYFASSKKSEKAIALALFLKAANQGHGQSAFHYAKYIDVSSEKDQWNRFARENGSHQALFNTICPNSWGNPLRLYMPKNKNMVCQWEEKKEMSSVNYYGSINYDVLHYNVSIFYDNELVLNKKIENTYSQAYAKSLYLAKFDKNKIIPIGIVALLTCPVSVPFFLCANCSASPCTCNWCRETYKDNKDRTRIANSIDTVTWEQNLSQLIREADARITEHLKLTKNIRNLHSFYANHPGKQQPNPIQPTVPPEIKLPSEIKLTDEQFKIWLAAQSLQQANAGVAPAQQVMEGQPFLRHSNPIPPQGVNPIYVVPSANPYPFFAQSNVPVTNIPMAQAMEMAIANPNQTVRLSGGARLTFQ